MKPFLNLSTLGIGISPTDTFSSPLESPIAPDACLFVVLLNICMHHHVLTTIKSFFFAINSKLLFPQKKKNYYNKHLLQRQKKNLLHTCNFLLVLLFVTITYCHKLYCNSLQWNIFVVIGFYCNNFEVIAIKKFIVINFFFLLIVRSCNL